MDKYGLRLVEERVLREIFGLNRERNDRQLEKNAQ
jgi:hypothetical protein